MAWTPYLPAKPATLRLASLSRLAIRAPRSALLISSRSLARSSLASLSALPGEFSAAFLSSSSAASSSEGISLGRCPWEPLFLSLSSLTSLAAIAQITDMILAWSTRTGSSALLFLVNRQRCMHAL